MRKKLSTKDLLPSNEKSRLVIAWLILGLAGFDSRDLDSEFMGKRRAVAAIEPIKSDAVFVADSVGSVDG